MAYHSPQTEQCCPEFDIAPWDRKTHVWQDKPFIKESIPVFFHIPWPPMIGRLVSRMWEKSKKADAAPEMTGVLVLSTDPSPWRSEWFMSVTKEVPDAENVKLSGTFITRVFDGPYNAVPKWIKEMDKYLGRRGQESRKILFLLYFLSKVCEAAWA